MSVQNVKKWQSSGELNWPWGFPRPFPYVGSDSPEVLSRFPVFVCLFLGSKVLEMGKAEKCPHPREPLSGTPTAQIVRGEMIVLWVPYTAPLFV